MTFQNQTKKVEDYLWVEKYRPTNLDDLVLDQETKSKFQQYIEDKSITHILLYGPPGCGKSTIARILVEHITPNNVDRLILNGSEQRGIDTVRNEIIEFLKYPPLNAKHRIVFIDEADALTDSAFSALRKVFEEFYQNGRFILTCNYVHKIPDPIKSRCVEFKFNELPLDFIKDRCKFILNNENIKFDEQSLDIIINYNYPDFRKIIQNIQKYCVNGSLNNININDIIDKEDIIVSKVKELVDFKLQNNISKTNKTIDEILQLINGSELNYVAIFKKIFDNKEINPLVKVLCNRYLNELNKAVLPQMHFSAFIFNIVEMLKKVT